MGEEEKHNVEQEKPCGYNINDNADLLAEILARLDGRSLCAAACVCRLWGAVSRKDAVWEALCNRHVSSSATDSSFPGTRTVVAALGGYRRLYRRCVGPIFDRLASSGDHGPQSSAVAAAAAARLSLSLFSIDCYERLSVGGRQRPSSLLFLGSAVDVT
ncbi:F-box protein SNE-like [Dendrobium catenatum]|uniref:F-box protein SNE n=1 Tax=Dendrobium catenatum TaxID=906689 RepID=A0A2I0W6M8_9ASPA|nr:F-box protein SNE-like [Dendrobium catenatum]PKU71311.1 F-box protein SNE [Dendrobium catenatum]